MKIGFAESEITPPLGVHLAGYFTIRKATDILDNLYARAAVIESNGKKLALVSCDIIGIGEIYIEKIKDVIVRSTDIEKDAILIHATHTHTGPRAVDKSLSIETDEEYVNYMTKKVASTVIMALEHMKEAVYGTGQGYEDRVAFVRRFKMKDGSYKTNPGVGNPNIVEPAGEIDPRIDLVDFKYTDGSGNLLFVSYSLHADMVGGTKISADYPGAIRRKVERAIPGCTVMYFTAAQGDINHIDVNPKKKNLKGYPYMTKVGNILGGEVIKEYENITYHSDFELGALVKRVTVPLRQYDKEDYKVALETISSHIDQTESKTGMHIKKAMQVRDCYEKGAQELDVTVFRIGYTGIVGFPGEPFIRYKTSTVKKSPALNTLVLCLTNGSNGYLPIVEAFAQGGYESDSSRFSPELESLLVNAGLEGLHELFDQ